MTVLRLYDVPTRRARKLGGKFCLDAEFLKSSKLLRCSLTPEAALSFRLLGRWGNVRQMFCTFG